MTIDANGDLHARDGKYTNRDRTAATDGLIRSAVADAQVTLDAAFEARKLADRGIAEARVGIIAAHVTDLYPDTATIVLANSPSGMHTAWQPAAFLDGDGDVLWEYSRDPKAALPDDDWVMIGEVIRQVQVIGSEHIDAVLPREKRTALARRAWAEDWVTHAGPRVIHIR